MLDRARLSIVVFAAWVASAAGDYFVNPKGSDAPDGSRATPFATMERARTAVRQPKADSRWPVGGVTVWLSAGDHVRTNTFELGAEDSRTETSPVVWRGATGPEVRILGGRPLSFVALADPEVLSRLDASANELPL